MSQDAPYGQETLGATEVEEVQADPFLDGARVALLHEKTLHVSPAMFDLLHTDTAATWRSIRVLGVPHLNDGFRNVAKMMNSGEGARLPSCPVRLRLGEGR